MKRFIRELVESNEIEFTVLTVDAVLAASGAPPFTGILLNAIKEGIGISDKIFISKAVRMFVECQDVNFKERIEFARELDDKNGDAETKIMLALDHMNTLEKSAVFGRLFKLGARKKITPDQFHRLTKLIQDAYLPDLLKFSGSGGYDHRLYSFRNLGLLAMEEIRRAEFRAKRTGEPKEPKLQVTRLGILFRLHKDYLLDGIVD